MPPPNPGAPSEARPGAEELPSLQWGLDPVFLACAKLYVKDILEMKESNQAPGIFFYNGHPIKQVDILGTVVEVRERDAFYSYGVDDASGVINCICWKKLSNTESSPALPDTAALNTAKQHSMTSQLKKLQDIEEQRTKIEIGDLIRVRGYIRTFREEREIRATIYYKVHDPMWDIQIARMVELPDLYRKVYDQTFNSPALQKEKTLCNPGALNLANLTSLLSEKIKEFLEEKRVQTFYRQELEMVESLMSVANQPVIHGACSNQEESKNTSKAIHSIFKNAVEMLQEKGLVFQKDGGFDNLYCVTREDKDLHKKIHQIIWEDCQKPNHIDKGCHFMHILACARLNLKQDLSKAVLQKVLEFLEDRSDIVSTSDHYYMSF